MNDHDPIIGNWYKNLETNADFVIVASDDHSQTLEIQYADGQLEELEMDTWAELLVETIEPPEDCAGALEAPNPEDLGYNSGETGINDTNHDPADHIDRIVARDQDDY